MYWPSREVSRRRDTGNHPHPREGSRVTEEAVNSVGGKMDAYQRMFNDEFDSNSIERYIEASEFSSEKRAKFDRHAATLTEEIMKNVMDAQTPAKP